MLRNGGVSGTSSLNGLGSLSVRQVNMAGHSKWAISRAASKRQFLISYPQPDEIRFEVSPGQSAFIELVCP